MRSAALASPDALRPVAPAMWPWRAWAVAVRAVVRHLVLRPLARAFCRPLVVLGSAPRGPVVFAANHTSHADTLALLAALPTRVRGRTAPAAAEDYFFRSRARSLLTSLCIGAFPFPRRGRLGLARARALLDAGRSVVLFPEGTRSRDGAIARFRPGVGLLASGGATVVPVAIAGTRDVIAKGGRTPRRAPVVVAFGQPVDLRGSDPAHAAATIERAVRRLHARAALVRPVPRPTWFERAQRFARSRTAVALAFGWAVAEAVVWPIVPDVPIALLAVVAPARAPALVAASVAGTVAGGGVAYAVGALGGASLLAHVPLTTEPMAERARLLLGAEGAGAVWHQPWSGIPFKAFALQAAGSAALGQLLWHTAWARGLRFACVAAVFALVGLIARRPLRATYPAFVTGSGVIFSLGIARVVAAWS